MVIRPTSGKDLRKTNPCTSTRSSRASPGGGKYFKPRYSTNESLTINVPSEEAVTKLLAVSKLSEVDMSATILQQYLANAAFMKGVDV